MPGGERERKANERRKTTVRQPTAGVAGRSQRSLQLELIETVGRRTRRKSVNNSGKETWAPIQNLRIPTRCFSSGGRGDHRQRNTQESSPERSRKTGSQANHDFEQRKSRRGVGGGRKSVLECSERGLFQNRADQKKVPPGNRQLRIRVAK